MIEFWKRIIKDNWQSIFWQIILMVCSTGISIVIAYIYMKIINKITDCCMPEALVFSGIYIFMLVMQYLMEVLITVCSKKMSNSIDVKLKKQVFEGLLLSSGKEISSTDSSEYTTLLLADTSKISDIISTLIMPSLLAIFRIVGMLVFLAYINIKLLFLVILIQPISIFLQSKLKSDIRLASEKNRNKTKCFIGLIKEYCLNLFEVITIGNNKYFTESIVEGAKTMKKSELELAIVNARNEGVIGFFSILPTVILLIIGGYEVANNTLTVGALLVYIQYYSSLFSPIGQVMENVFSYESYIPSITNVMNVYNKVPFTGDNCSGGILEFRNVEFEYEKGQKVLSNFNIKLCPGKVHGIYGKSGCGKSTMCKLLLGFWSPTSGEISINGKQYDDIDKDILRKNICYISQEDYMFNDSIYNNIVLGRECSNQRFSEILHSVNINKLVDELPDNENTIIGDQGALISGGQKKRIALARSLVKKNHIVILDEPTNGLDSENAMDIIKKMIELHKDSIIIIISHQKEIIDMCDQKYCIENGRLVYV